MWIARRRSLKRTGQRRIDEGFRQAVARDAGPSCRFAAPERLGHHRPQQLRGTLGGGGVEHGHGQRLPEALIGRRLAPEEIADAGAPGPGQFDRRHVVRGAASGGAAPGAEDPPGHDAAIGPHGPALAGRKIDERDRRGRHRQQFAFGADRGEIAHRRAIARQQQVIAVVDLGAEQIVEVRAAAAARLARCLVHDHARARLDEPDRRGEPRDARADDVHRCAGGERHRR
jgi:hypothetical protein